MRASTRLSPLADVVFRPFTQEADLGGGAFVRSITQGGDGFIWIGTEAGLARFDGYRVRMYTADATNPGSLPDSDVRTVFTDPLGHLWAVTNSSVVARYDVTTDRFVTYGAKRGTTALGTIDAIAEDGTGGVWLGTAAGLEHLEAGSDGFTVVATTDLHRRRLPPMSIGALLRDRNGILWIGTTHRLLRYDDRTHQASPVALPATGVRFAGVGSLFEDRAGTIWVGTLFNGVMRVDPRSRRALPLPVDGLSNLQVFSITQSRAGDIWLGTFGEAIIVINPTTLRVQHIRHDPLVAASLADDHVMQVFKDNAGRLWFITLAGIQSVEPDQSSAIETVFGKTDRPGGLESQIEAIAIQPDGRIWLGTADAQVDIIEPGGYQVTQRRHDAHKTSFPQARPVDFASLDPTTMIVGTTAGLYRTDADGTRFARIDVPGRDPLTPTFSLLAHNDELWVGGDGLWELTHVESGGFRVRRHISAQQLGDPRVDAIVAAFDGAIWIGNLNGLFRIDPQSSHIEHFVADRRSTTGLAASEVMSLLIDRRGRLWVGTFGGGINVLDMPGAGKSRQFHHIGTAQGLPQANVDAIAEDHAGSLWVSTDGGLASIDPTTFAVQSLHTADGVAISNYWTASAATTPDGDVLFGGLGGLTVVHPAAVRPWSYKPPIVITDIAVGGKSVPSTMFNIPNYTGELTVEPTANSVSVEFAALDFSAPERNVYEYQLEGFDRGWIESNASHRLASYTNLAPGTYRLRIRGSNRNGDFSLREAGLTIRVVPALNQTIWFGALELGALIAFFLALVQLRTRYLRRRQSELEAEVIRRTAELTASHEQLEALANHDLLTGLPNRRRFIDEFDRHASRARRQGERFGLLLMDLDRFKSVNDTYGHAAGDALLVETAARLSDAVRCTDCVARLGGDEFGIVLEDCSDLSDVEDVCQRIVASFMLPVVLGETSIATSLSIGLALFPDDGTTEQALYHNADAALYAAKRAGRNTWRWYAPPAGRTGHDADADIR